MGRSAARSRSLRQRRLLTAAVVSALASCAPPPFVPAPFEPVAEPAPSETAAVVFLVGDAGDLPLERSPLLHHLRDDVELWSERAASDSLVTVLFLGDNVYPVGIRDRGDRNFPADSARLYAQVWTVLGPRASQRGTTAHFLAGNHDWGNKRGPAGVARLANMERLLAELGGARTRVRLSPAAGDPGPAAVDVGPAVRLLLLDTHWWLQSDEEEQKAEAVDRLASQLFEGRDRTLVVAAHHPFTTAGRHGGYGIDLYFLLRKAGAVVQGVTAAPFQELHDGLSRAFRESERPLVFVGGHDHSLQVHRTAGPGSPAWSLVSGAGSKITPVGAAPGLEWAGAQPGYMKLVVRTDGRVDLFVEAAPPDALRCEGRAPEACVARGAAAFRTVFSIRLR